MKKSNSNTSRRNFLNRILLGWVGMLSLPALFVVIKYLIPPNLRESMLNAVFAAKVSEITVTNYKIVRFNKRPVILIRTEAGEIKAFSAVCTHLGCVVDFEPENRRFHCNCHDSMYDLDGKNYAGPAKLPLAPFKVDVKGSDITISSS